MPNLVRGESELVVGEGRNARRFKLVLDANAFCEIEGALNIGLPELMRTLAQKPSIRVFRALLYGALYREHRMTVEEAGDLIGEAGFDLITERIEALVASAMPQEGDLPPGKTKPPVAKAHHGPGQMRSKVGARQVTTRKASGGRRQG